MRTTVTLAILLALAVPVTARPAVRHRAVAARPTSRTLPDTADIRALRSAYQFAFPIYAMMRTRGATVTRTAAYGIDGINRLFPRTALADASSRDVTTPNNDTLYASAWLDLSGGPVRFDMPPMGRRYHSAALMNLFTDNVAIVGTRSGDGSGRYLIVGPGWHGEAPDGVKLLRSDTNDAWLLARVLVDGPSDLAAASAAVGTLKLDASLAHATPTKAVPTPEPDAATLLDVVNEALGRTPLPPEVAARIAAMAPQGIRPGASGVFAQLSPAAQKLWTTALPLLRNELKAGIAGVGTVIDGWNYPGPGIGNFGADDAGRARVALGGLAALPREEAVYLTASTDQAGAPLNGGKAYIAHIPGHLPVGAFWSLTMYQVEADGRLFFVDNPLGRFALGSRSDTMHAERDGSLDIFIQTSQPSGERVVNWLPAPKGALRLVFRAYLPKDGLRDSTLHLPPVTVSEVVP